MLPQEINYIIQWENQYSKGKRQYLFLNTLVWGSVLASLLMAIKLASLGQLSLLNLAIQLFTFYFLCGWIICLALVFCCSSYLWYKAGKKYAQLKAKQAAERH